MMEQMCSSDFGEYWGPLPGTPLDKGLPSPAPTAQAGVGWRARFSRDSPMGEPPEPFPWTLCAWDGCTRAEDIGGGTGRTGHSGGSLETSTEHSPPPQQPLPLPTQ